MEKLQFKDEYIFQGEEIIGIYSYRDENSSFWPTKQKVFWATIFEHESQSDDFIWWAFSVAELKSKVRKYLLNRENGVKDLPQISEQIDRIISSAWEFTGAQYGYYTAKQSDAFKKITSRLNLVEEVKKRGFAFYGKQLVPAEIYRVI